MAGLTQDSKGNYRVRKRLPDDVREEYGRLYGPRYEAKFFAPKILTRRDATRHADTANGLRKLRDASPQYARSAKAKAYR